MRLTTPNFWYDTKKLESKAKSLALVPFSLLYAAGYQIHQCSAKPYKAAVPVLCIGNLVTGGSGKTPTVLALVDLINSKKLFNKPFCISRGYGGSEKGPVIVNDTLHNASQVGDEPILLSKKAPCIISNKRDKGAKLAEKLQADLIIMDDGLQNTSLHKSLKIAVIDGTYGFGNKRMLPAGPLRQPLQKGLLTADAFILIGKDTYGIKDIIPKDKPIINAKITVPESWIYNQKMPYVAFAGMGVPEKFYSTLWTKGINVTGWHAFPDHYIYSENDIMKLVAEAKKKNARLITTEKDAVRISNSFNIDVPLDIMPVILEWEDVDTLCKILTSGLENGA